MAKREIRITCSPEYKDWCNLTVHKQGCCSNTYYINGVIIYENIPQIKQTE